MHRQNGVFHAGDLSRYGSRISSHRPQVSLVVSQNTNFLRISPQEVLHRAWGLYLNNQYPSATAASVTVILSTSLSGRDSTSVPPPVLLGF